MNFEIHITIPKDSMETAKSIAESLNWKTSAIDGDPVLGSKVYGYLTTHSVNLRHAMSRMEECVVTLRQRGIHVLREKIEVIVHDARHNMKQL